MLIVVVDDGGTDREALADQVDAVLAAARVLVAVSARSLSTIEDIVTLTQLRLLVELHSHGPQSLQKLADRADLTTSNAGRACAKLADLGLITRRRSLRDPRNPAIATSAKGNRLVESIVTRRRTSAEEILRRIPSRARADVARAMQQFAAAGGALAWRDAFGPVGQSVSRNHPARRAPLADQQR